MTEPQIHQRATDGGCTCGWQPMPVGSFRQMDLMLAAHIRIASQDPEDDDE
jgi:hypothetical protein